MGNKKPKKNRGPRKGGSFEREFSRFLSKWWTSGKDPHVFWRSPGSGSMGTRVLELSGDICAVKPDGVPLLKQVCFELKRTKVHNLIDFFTHSESFLHSWIFQVRRESGKKEPVLVFKMDRRPEIVGIREHWYNQIRDFLVNYRLMTVRENNVFSFVLLPAKHFFTDKLREYLREKGLDK